MNDIDRRHVLGMVARREVFRDRFGDTFRWQGTACPALTRREAETLADLESDGLVVLLDGTGERYWDVTDKALEG